MLDVCPVRGVMFEGRVLVADRRGEQRRYQLGSRIGAGGFANVWNAIELETHRHFAVKVIPKASIKSHQLRLVQDEIYVHARDVTKAKHEYIVNLENAGEESDVFFLILEYCPGGDLETEHRRRKEHRGKDYTWSEEEVRKIVYQLAQALNYLHRNNVVHRDIKLSNIFLTKDGDCRLGDFGLSVKLKESSGTQQTFCGTPNYIAPEMASHRPYSFPVDIWGLGVVMYTLLVGEAPFDAGNFSSTVKNVQVYSPKVPLSVNRDAMDLLDGMLQKKDVDRLSLESVLSHPFLQPNSSSKCGTTSSSLGMMTCSDSGIGSNSRYSQPLSSTTRKGPDIRPPLLGNISEIETRKRTPISPRTPDYGQSQQTKTASSTAPLAKPFSTTRLKPSKELEQQGPNVKGGILKSGKVQFEFRISRKNGFARHVSEVITVSPNGLQIWIEREGSLREYQHSNLPQKYRQKYNYIAKYVQSVLESTPKLTLYTEDAQCALMENLPVANFRVEFFSSGKKVQYQASSDRVTVYTREGTKESLSYPASAGVSGHASQILQRFQELHIECKNMADHWESRYPNTLPLVIGDKQAATRHQHGNAQHSPSNGRISSGSTVWPPMSLASANDRGVQGGSMWPPMSLPSMSSSKMSISKYSFSSEKLANGDASFNFKDGTKIIISGKQPPYYINLHGEKKAITVEQHQNDEMTAKVESVQDYLKQISQHSLRSRTSSQERI